MFIDGFVIYFSPSPGNFRRLPRWSQFCARFLNVNEVSRCRICIAASWRELTRNSFTTAPHQRRLSTVLALSPFRPIPMDLDSEKLSLKRLENQLDNIGSLSGRGIYTYYRCASSSNKIIEIQPPIASLRATLGTWSYWIALGPENALFLLNSEDGNR